MEIITEILELLPMKRVETSSEFSSKKAGFISILNDSAGEEEVEFMKELAREGKG